MASTHAFRPTPFRHFVCSWAVVLAFWAAGCAPSGASSASVRQRGKNETASTTGTPRKPLLTVGQQEDPSLVLKGDVEFGVVSFNLDYRQGMQNIAQVFETAIQGGQKFDIIGFQEFRDPLQQPENPDYGDDARDFIQIMNNLGGGNARQYACMEQQVRHGHFASVICSAFPIVDGSYVEWEVESGRVVQCAEIETPAGIVVLCNTHLQNKEDTVDQFRRAEAYILEDVLDMYVPEGMADDEREAFKKSLVARTFFTGDMNADPHKIVGNMVSGCASESDPAGGWCSIDQVLYFDMTRPGIGGSAPFDRNSFSVTKAFRDPSLGWPSDHGAPTVVNVRTQELRLPASPE